MAFDKDAYRDTYLRPKSRAKVPPSPDDIFDRYAIKLPASDADIQATIKAVRSCWNSQQAGTPMAKLAKMCLAADEDLKQQKIEAGPFRGKAMMTASWWEEKRQQQEGAAGERVTKLAGLLKDSNGAFGVVTRSYLATCADRLSLNAAQAEKAAKQVGLEVVEDVKIPTSAPFSQFGTFDSELSVGQVPTVPELVIPACSPFHIVDRFESTKLPDSRLDMASIQNQALEAAKQQNTATWNARRSALSLLRSAVEGGTDLRDIAIYHLVQAATCSGVPGTAGIKAEMISRGLTERDANILAVVLGEGSGPKEPLEDQLKRLLQEGRLREAMSLASGAPEGSVATIKDVVVRIETQKARLQTLLEEARALIAAPDEIGAAAKLREVAAISIDDADEMRSLLPLPPVRDLRISTDGNNVRLHWQPNVGHDGDTTYQVVRSANGAPANPSNGTPVTSIDGTSATDGAAPVAQITYYSVFASVPGRPTSRAANGQTVSLPPVFDARMETGRDWVAAHWSQHPGVRHVEAARRDRGSATPVPVQLSSAELNGLPEGVSVHLELTAVYEKPEGGILKSDPVAVSGTPLAAAKALENLRAQPIAGAGGVQVRMTWTPVDRSEVRLRRHTVKPRWNVGEMVPAVEMAGWGRDVTGPTTGAAAKMQLDAILPAGVSYVVPFSVGGTGIVVGKVVSVGVTDPVSGLTITPFSGFARLAWTWPTTSTLAEISWERDDNGPDAVGLVQVTKSEYDSKGAMVPLGPAPCKVEVRAVMMIGAETFYSPPIGDTISLIAKSKVAYKVSSSPGIGRLGGRTKTLTLTASENTGPLRIKLVASPGIVMPTEPTDGVAILDQTVTLSAGQSKSLSTSLPKAISRPYWVRAFLVSGEAQLVDPQLTTLKEG